jgi:argininosuccinate lyase
MIETHKHTRESTMAALWGGGFAEPMHQALADLSNSVAQDLPLADADLRASVAYVRALALARVLTEAEAALLSAALEAIRIDLAAGSWVPGGAEDIHAAIETELVRRVGELAERLHTGRSRNDQVATAFRMAVRQRAAALIDGVHDVAGALLGRAEGEIETLLPAYTHLQRAQPVRLAHWLLAHFWPLVRDIERLSAADNRAAVLPLGSGAATGHAFDIDREWMAAELGFRAVSPNSLDAVGDRDFAVELVFACTLLAVHLSRLAEDLVIWSSAEFGFVHWPDALATGSSLMPNKKNPDLAELVRGRSAASIGDLTAILVLLKGVPSSYQRDLQEDKPPVWRVTQATQLSLAAMAVAIDRVAFDRERMRSALTDEILATEAADAAVGRGVPFRIAHRAVAEVVAGARRAGCGLRELALTRGAELPSPLVPADFEGLDFETAVERRTSAGGTARGAVIEQLQQARSVFELGAR